MPDLPEPMPAATLVLMREASVGPPELLMMERTGHMAFAAGALVFPGGRIDPEDHDAAGRLPGFPDAAARIAAVRETIEETGIAPAIVPEPDPARVRALREGIRRDLPLDRLLEQHGLALELGALTPFARWCPNFRETRRFDTYFYLAAAPAGAPEPSASAQEAVRVFWASAADILREIEAGAAHAIFPTRRNLERLARFGSIDEARADAVRHPVRTIIPWVEERHGRPHVCIPEDAGYPITAEPLETARRS
ncbi:NUDIX domain-containing protein [Sphingosinicella sp. CPCC 101087]|uniref:NUDIX hydrolase n=1 Tax=Sphingosinicella sp. CPCC 101087 TaxID=2497754 RepID=UPI00101C7AEB|nr:NUDIX domain-containing protein [Sphingosinicella sp. CPCC 101087]